MTRSFRIALLLALAVPANRLLAQEAAAPAATPAAPAATSADAAAPAAEAAPEITGPPLKATNDEATWTFELNGDGKGVMAAVGDAIVFVTSKTAADNWAVQAYQGGLKLTDGKEYVLKFKAKSPESMPILVMSQVQGGDWHESGLHQEVSLTPDYKDYEYTFTASGAGDEPNRVGLILGTSTGVTYVKDMTLDAK